MLQQYVILKVFDKSLSVFGNNIMSTYKNLKKRQESGEEKEDLDPAIRECAGMLRSIQIITDLYQNAKIGKGISEMTSGLVSDVEKKDEQ